MTTFLVTGASGFVGSHVVSELLREGYTVRGSVRGHNVARVNKGYESFGDRFVVVSLTAWSRRTWWHMRYAGPSVPVSSYLMAEHILGVDAIIHVASPLSISATPDVVLETAVTGTTRIFNAALVAGIKKLVITESTIARRAG
ncbi:hypothetical protein EDB86DRAFT_206708 [Lactarius hatsudake]|nr:hypothetical protein EDB86DRAFT_206708 [Lactarius hatsudake]